MLALVVWIGSNNTGEDGARLVFTNIPKSENLQNIMMKPHYQGVNKNNKPYTITAEKGLQKDKDTVVLDSLRADMNSQNGTWIAMNAGTGEMNMTARTLKLTDGVEVFYDGGYQFRSKQADVDVGKGTAVGNSPVEGQGRAGTLQANSFTITERGNVIRFNGSVRMVLYR